MSDLYDITLRQEVLTEYASKIVAKYCRYIDNKKISKTDKNNIFIVKLDKLSTIMREIIVKYDTEELLNTIENELKQYNKFIKIEEEK